MRKMVIELLVARCPNVKAVQELAQEYGVSDSPMEWDKDNEYCILCGLCVRACNEVVGACAIQFFRQHFVASLVAILLLDVVERHFARAEARHLHVFARALEALFHFLLDISDCDGEVDAAFEFVSLCSGCFHEYSL